MERIVRKFEERLKKLNNKGVTLVELVCAIAIIAVLSLAVASIMIVSSRTYAKGSTDIALQEEAQLLSNQVERLVQFASDASLGASSSELVIVQASTGKTYRLTHDASTKLVSYTDESTGNTAPMAENISELQFTVTDFAEDGVVKMYVVASKDGTDFKGNFTISSRNISKNNIIPGGDITMTLVENYVLEPNETQPLTAQMSDGSDINWAMAGNTDANTVLSFDAVTGKKTITIGRDETANVIFLTASSQLKMADGVTPLVEKTVNVHIRRVKDIDLDFTNDTRGDKSKTAMTGDQYTITAKGVGTNLTNMAPATVDRDPGYQNEDGTDGLYMTVNPQDVLWNVDVIIKGVSQYDPSTEHKGKDVYANYEDQYIACIPNESVYSGTGPSFKLKLKFSLDTGDQIIVTAKAKHPLGGIEKLDAANNTYTEQTNLLTGKYDEVTASWLIYKDVFKYDGNGFSRASDDPQGEIYVDNIINILRAYYGNDVVNAEHWNSDSILRSHRFREVTLNENSEIVTKGMWTNWRYLGSSPEQDRGNSLNVRPAATASLECDKTYQVELRLFILDHNGNEVYPIAGFTPEGENIVSGIVNPVSIYMSASYQGDNWQQQNLFSKSLGGSFVAPAGKNISITRNEVKYIKNDPTNMLLSFAVQMQIADGSWVAVSSFDDYNNFKDPYAIYLRINGNGQGTDGISEMAFQHKGRYRVVMSHIKVPYTKYVPASDKYVDSGLTRDYAYFDETTSKGVFEFVVNEDSDKWKEKFIEFDGKIYSADDYFVCDNILFEKRKYNKKEFWDGSKNQLMFYSQNGSSGDMYVAENRVDYVHYSYSYVGSDPKSFTVNGTTLKSKNDLNKADLPAVVKELIKEKVGWW